jgi:hypothetical protein
MTGKARLYKSSFRAAAICKPGTHAATSKSSSCQQVPRISLERLQQLHLHSRMLAGNFLSLRLLWRPRELISLSLRSLYRGCFRKSGSFAWNALTRLSEYPWKLVTFPSQCGSLPWLCGLDRGQKGSMTRQTGSDASRHFFYYFRSSETHTGCR